jgi:ABC-type polysaccharide/polyol phosphate export permease
VALVPWMFFSSSVTDGAASILKEKDMVKKIYFPREVLPISTVTSAFVNMILTFVVVSEISPLYLNPAYYNNKHFLCQTNSLKVLRL